MPQTIVIDHPTLIVSTAEVVPQRDLIIDPVKVGPTERSTCIRFLVLCSSRYVHYQPFASVHKFSLSLASQYTRSEIDHAKDSKPTSKPSSIECKRIRFRIRSKDTHRVEDVMECEMEVHSVRDARLTQRYPFLQLEPSSLLSIRRSHVDACP